MRNLRNRISSFIKNRYQTFADRLNKQVNLSLDIFQRVVKAAVIDVLYRVHCAGTVERAVRDISKRQNCFRAHVLPHGAHEVYAGCVLRDGIVHLGEGGYDLLKSYPCGDSACGEFFRHAVSLEAKRFKALFAGVRAVDNADSKLFHGIAYLIQIPCAVLGTVGKDSEHIACGKSHLLELHGILRDIIQQFAGIIETVLSAAGDIIIGFGSRYAEVFHHSLDRAGTLCDVVIKHVLEGVCTLGDFDKFLVVKFAEILLDFRYAVCDILEPLAEIFAVDLFNNRTKLIHFLCAGICCSDDFIYRAVQTVRDLNCSGSRIF